MGVAVPRAPVVNRSPEPPQKFGNGPYFVGQMLSRNQVLQNNQGQPPPPPLNSVSIYSVLFSGLDGDLACVSIDSACRFKVCKPNL